MQDSFENYSLNSIPISREPIAISKEEKENENFFSYKRKKWIFFWIVVFICIFCISIKFLLNFQLSKFFVSLSSVSGNSHFLFTILFGFSTFFVCEVFVRVFSLKQKLKDRLNHVSRFEWFNFSVLSFVIQSITPFSLGSEPYSIWWLKKRGIPLKEASAVVAVTSFCWFVGQFFITWPSFIWITAQNWTQITSLSITKVYWAVLAGLLVDIAVAAFIFVISYSSKAHYQISIWANKIRRYFGFSYSTTDEISHKYLIENIFQKLYVKELLTKSTFKVIFIFLLNNVWVYGLFAGCGRLFYNSNNSFTVSNFFDLYHLINIATTANNFLPLPSAEGSLQITIQQLMDLLKERGVYDLATATEVHGNTIFMWRFFNKYFGMMLGLIFICLWGFNSSHRWIWKFSKCCRKSDTSLVLTF